MVTVRILELNYWNRASFDDAKTLRQKAAFANKQCLGGTFAWALDLGGPGSLIHPSKLNDTGDLNLEGADPNGDDSNSGEVYVSPEVYKDGNLGVGCIPPCTFIMPPISLSSATTITFPPYTTSLEVAWPTTSVVTLPGGERSTSTGYSRTIQETVLSIPPGMIII